jgi:hypothetical protein
MDEKATWAIKDGHGQEIRNMEAKGHSTGSCSSVYDNVHVHRQMRKHGETWTNRQNGQPGTNMYRKPVRWKGKDVLGVYVVACKYISTKHVSAAATELKLY